MEERKEGDERKEERKQDVLPDFKTMSISCECTDALPLSRPRV